MTHVDDFVDDYEGPKYPRWFFFLHRLPAHLKACFHEYIAPNKLFCTFNGQRWRVTGASRMGDIWLSPNFERENGYEKRVDLDDCSNWGPEP